MTSLFSADAVPRVSVLMPVYNGARYLPAAIDSVLAQSFGAFEFLILDDGSTDETPRILAGYAAHDPRIRVITRENRGLTASLNELAGIARGQYLARMDADDICFTDRFAQQVTFLDAHPDCIVLGGWALMIDEADRPIIPLKPPLEHAKIDSGNMSGQTSFIHPSVMIRRDTFSMAGGYDPQYPDAEDKELWLRMAEIGRLANLPRFLLRYRMHNQSISSKKHSLQEELSRKASADAAIRRGIANPFDRKPYRANDTRESQRDFSIKYGWQAWTWGFQTTWRHYALRAVRLDPLSLAAWKLLVFGALRRSPHHWEPPT